MGKTLDRMRLNPKADWRTEDIEKACREVDFVCMKPSRGSHYKDRGPVGRAPLYDPRSPAYKGQVHPGIPEVPERDWQGMTSDPKLVSADGRSFDPSAYEVHLRPLSDEEGCGWFAAIPALPGCMGDGETEMDAIADVRFAALEWADAALADGEPVPAPHHGSLQAAE